MWGGGQGKTERGGGGGGMEDKEIGGGEEGWRTRKRGKDGGQGKGRRGGRRGKEDNLKGVVEVHWTVER